MLDILDIILEYVGHTIWHTRHLCNLSTFSLSGQDYILAEYSATQSDKKAPGKHRAARAPPIAQLQKWKDKPN